MRPGCIINEARGPAACLWSRPVGLKGNRFAEESCQGGLSVPDWSHDCDITTKLRLIDRGPDLPDEQHHPPLQTWCQDTLAVFGGGERAKLIPTDLNQKADCLGIPITSPRRNPLSSLSGIVFSFCQFPPLLLSSPSEVDNKDILGVPLDSRGKEAESGGPVKEKSKKTSLTKDEVALYRNSHKHSVSVDMLRKGYHRSFCEFLALIHRWNASREAAEPGSAIWQQQPLEEQPHKLDQLQHFLTRAEAAQRAGLYEEVYENQVALACYFVEPEDKWLSYHFYEASLVSARMVKTDGGRKEAEANSNLGHVYMEQGQLERAREHYEAFHHLTETQAWKDEAGRTLRSQACECLWRIYTLLADKMLENEEHGPAIETLTKAFEMAQEAGDKKIEGKAAYRVGLAYQCVGDQETAKRYLNMYMDISTVLGDDESLGKAYEAIAKSLESEGKLAETVEYLEKFVEVSQDDGLHHNLQEACMCLGIFFSSRGQYDRGCGYFERAYEIARKRSDAGPLQKAQVYLGHTRACAVMAAYSGHVAAAGPVDTRKLLAWKESRNDTFSEADTERSQ
ncbi:tetratricopeptide repeat protein 29 [Megalops cyprinoides]|uniref:tetratricopeptide repeat protein 29 n=1 Tax=Megalops cyprinoides TaxID=118141 RepID=UPI0018653E64|nr:tetratricopeptide repeat protein 29 [Megalops cyprinoides]